MGNKLELKYFNRPVQQKHMFWLSGANNIVVVVVIIIVIVQSALVKEREMQPGLECTPTNTHVEGLIYGEQFCCCCRGLTVEQDQL